MGLRVSETPNYFQRDGDRYARFRPQYTKALARSLRSLTVGDGLALDVGCGNGQLAVLLAEQFDHVVGVDSSEEQIAHAIAAENVSYRCAAADALGLPDGSVDLIVVAQAAHWFDLERFYEEVRRVAKPGAAIALITYGVPTIPGEVGEVFHEGYWYDLHDWWPAERAHVENGYADLDFPFPPLALPDISYCQSMSAEAFIGYITTWSAFTKAVNEGSETLFEAFFDRLRAVWPAGDRQEVRWPITVRAGRVDRDT